MKNKELIQEELATVKKLTNIYDDKRITLNDIGWTSRVYLIDNGRIVFKFPRNELSRIEYAREVETLKLLRQQQFNVLVPTLNWSTQNNDYICLFGIEGKLLSKDVISQLSEEERIKIGTDLGLFLKQLHSLKPEKETYTMTVDEEITEHQEKYLMSLPVLKTYFNTEQLAIIEDLFMKEAPIIMSDLGEDLVFSHGDLGYYNIILSENHKIGVIDFGDAGFHDRSLDFVGMEDQIIKETAIITYGDDEILRKKIDIRQKTLPILEILFYDGKNDKAGVERCIRLIESCLNLANR